MTAGFALRTLKVLKTTDSNGRRPAAQQTHKEDAEHVNGRLINVAAKWPRLCLESALVKAVCRARGAVNDDAQRLNKAAHL